jgi:hypothetical protein
LRLKGLVKNFAVLVCGGNGKAVSLAVHGRVARSQRHEPDMCKALACQNMSLSVGVYIYGAAKVDDQEEEIARCGPRTVQLPDRESIVDECMAPSRQVVQEVPPATRSKSVN